MAMKMRVALSVLGIAMIFALPSATAADKKKLLPGADGFALKLLLNSLTSKNLKNTVMSPLSAQIALSILLPGAEGSTESVMKKGLKVQGTNKMYLAAVRKLLKKLKNSDQVQIASTVFFSKRFTLLDSYKKLIKSNFHTVLQQLNFNQTEEAAKVINKWCTKATGGLIKRTVSSNDIDSLTRLIIVNAIHFKATWENQFNGRSTENEDFVTIGKPSKATKKIKVRMMHSDEPWHCMFNDNHKELDAQILQLNYELHSRDFDSYRMVIILPKKVDGVMETLNKLQDLGLSKVMDKLKEERVIVSLPKFNQEVKLNLNAVLTKMGFSEMFHKPNFKGITKTEEGVFISKVFQKVIISVAEEGTEAAVVTTELMTGASAPEDNPPRTYVFTADHPFIYFIMPRNEPLPIFQGVVMKPQWKE